jgi:uncharacterized membrane protein
MTRPWAKYLLIASLALNLLVVGALASAAFRGRHMSGGQGGTNIFGFMDQLAKERREALAVKARELRPQLRDLREQSRAAARERADALLAEPFDRQRYINAQTRQIETDGKLRVLMRDAVAEIAGTMTLEERQAFLRWRGQRRMHGSSDPSLDEPPQKRR